MLLHGRMGRDTGCELVCLDSLLNPSEHNISGHWSMQALQWGWLPLQRAMITNVKGLVHVTLSVRSTPFN